jgi:murein DD-endopeptidase MepM/ murein hydrolase activator NlpD
VKQGDIPFHALEVTPETLKEIDPKHICDTDHDQKRQQRNIEPHMGIDFTLSENTPIFAPRDNIIKKISKKRGSGKFLVLEHDQNYFTVYNHLQSVAAALKEGQKVKAGEVLAYVGCSGYCTSPHLHFAIRKGKKMLNPAYLTKPYPFSAKNYRDSLEYKNLFAKK